MATAATQLKPILGRFTRMVVGGNSAPVAAADTSQSEAEFQKRARVLPEIDITKYHTTPGQAPEEGWVKAVAGKSDKYKKQQLKIAEQRTIEFKDRLEEVKEAREISQKQAELQSFRWNQKLEKDKEVVGRWTAGVIAERGVSRDQSLPAPGVHRAL